MAQPFGNVVGDISPWLASCLSRPISLVLQDAANLFDSVLVTAGLAVPWPRLTWVCRVQSLEDPVWDWLQRC